MTQSTRTACPRCNTYLDRAAKFCANCGADISGVWGPNGEALSKTVAVEVDPNVDTLGQLLSSATLGEYDIYGELGRGGMAAVYLALDLALNRKVAIKTMLPELMTREGMVPRFKREAQTAAGLSHPHIIQIFTVKDAKTLVYFVMKFIEGRSLESIILEKGQVPLEMAQIILGQVASALAYAHRKGVVHRDIKPANIMIDEDGWAIVTDFGIAKVQEAQNLTATGTAIGTPHYMSPEQFHNKAITGASDQYSLGVVAYEILLGKKPFDGATYAEIITQHLFEPVPDLRSARPEIPEHVAIAVKRMLSKDPAERFPDLDAAAAELGTPPKKDGDMVRTQMVSLAKNGPQKKLRMSVPMSPVPATRKPAAATVVERQPAAPKARSRGGLIAAAAAVVLVVGGFGAWKMMSGTAPSPAPQQVSSETTAASGGAVTPAGTESKTEAPAPTVPVGDTKSTEPATSAATPARAQITVSNLPNGARITFDGRRQSNRQFTAAPGTYTLRVEATGFEPMTRRLTLEAGEREDIAFERRPVVAPAPSASVGTKQADPQPVAPANQGLATLRFILTPPATLYVDGNRIGEFARHPGIELVPGTHTLRAEKDGFVTKDTVVTVTAGKTETIRINLTQRP
jgi:serine/threonine protein kinase